MNNRCVFLATILVGATVLVPGALPPDADAYALASPSACPAQKNPRAARSVQERSLRCLVEHLRVQRGVRRLSANRALKRAARRKAKDLARCGFSHNACGRSADAWAKRFGYDSASSWRWGETLANGSRHMTAREALKAWLRSAPHRSTLLRRPFEHAGVALRRSGGRDYWVLQLGCHGC